MIITGAFLRLNGLAMLGPLGDELEDLAILNGLHSDANPFGHALFSDYALDQARGPFFLTLSVSSIVGRADLQLARYVSVFCALLAIVAVFLLGRELFSTQVGLLAASFQAFSIYDIGFSHLALTSSSSLFVFWYLVSLVALFRAMRTKQLVWCWAAAVAIGISMGAKFFGVFTLLIAAGLLLSQENGLKRRLSHWFPETRTARSLLIVNVLCLFICLGVATIEFLPGVKMSIFIITMLGMICIHYVLLRRERAMLKDEAFPAVFLIMLTMTTLYMFINSPTHLNANRLMASLDWVPRWYHAPFADTHLWDFVSVLLVRLNAPFNIFWLAALIFMFRKRGVPEHRFLLYAFAVPFVILSLIRWKCTWYLMMVFPICYVMIAAFLMKAYEVFPQYSITARRSSIVACVGLFAWYVSQMVLLQPYYEIDGYRLGPAFIGLSKPSFVTFEGIPTMVAWMDNHLPAHADVACLTLKHPAYNDYTHAHMIWRRSGTIEYRQVNSLEDAMKAPFVFTSLYTQQYERELQQAGYAPLKTFWIKRLRYGVVYGRDSGGGRA